METRSIDPRDVSWELHSPTFRVTFWRKGSVPKGIDPSLAGYEAFEYEIRDGDVHEVIEWANDIASREGKSYTIYVVVNPESNDDKGLVLLAGVDPTRQVD